jgi:hypothetical protein
MSRGGGMSILVRLLFMMAVLALSSCASTVHSIQPQIHNKLVAQDFNGAIAAFDKGPIVYGSRNELLYWLDRSLVLHLSGRYEESIKSFEETKRRYDALYAKSISEVAGSVFINDYWRSYRGEDYQYVLVNIFQALNYAALGNIDEALVEIRQVDQKLKLIRARYPKDQPYIYKEDAFARALGGILYDAAGLMDDARIDYSKALRIYEKDYFPNYGTVAPTVVKSALNSPEDKKRKAQVYVVEYTGFIPIKEEDMVLIPLDETHIARLAFPKYVPRPSQVASSIVAASKTIGIENNMPTEVGQDISAIAEKVLENHKAWTISKGLLRPGVKYALEKVGEKQLQDHDQNGLAVLLMIAGNIFNVISEKADLREWEMLPGQIRIAHLSLEPGTYTIKIKDYNGTNSIIENKTLGSFELKAGEKKFLITRSYY